MTENHFLQYFITEPVYVIHEPLEHPREEQQPVKKSQSVEVQEGQEQKNLVYKGNNRSKVFIIVDQPGETYISPATEDFLGKVLKAIQLQTADTGILNLRENPGVSSEAILALDAEKYLTFGVNSGLFEETLPPYEIIELEKHKHVLSCAALEVISKDASQKKLLWTALQKMFL